MFANLTTGDASQNLDYVRLVQGSVCEYGRL